MAKMVGFEPTRPFRPIAFRVRPLEPLEYIFNIIKLSSLKLRQIDKKIKCSFIILDVFFPLHLNHV